MHGRAVRWSDFAKIVGKLAQRNKGLRLANPRQPDVAGGFNQAEEKPVAGGPQVEILVDVEWHHAQCAVEMLDRERRSPGRLAPGSSRCAQMQRNPSLSERK